MDNVEESFDHRGKEMEEMEEEEEEEVEEDDSDDDGRCRRTSLTVDDIINNIDCAMTANGRAAGGGGGDHNGDDMDVSLLASFAS